MKLGVQVGSVPATLCWMGSSSPPPPKRAQPQFSAHVCCGQTARWIKMPPGGQGDFVLDGDPAPPQKRGHSPQFWAHVYCGQTAGWIKMPLGTEVGFGPGDIVLSGDLGTPKKGHSPQFSALGSCGQTAGRIIMPLGTEVGLGPGDFVLDGDSAPSPKKEGAAQPPPPIFGPCLFWPLAKRLYGLRYHLVGRWASGQWPGDIVLDWDPRGAGSSSNTMNPVPPPPEKRGTTPIFRPMSIMAKRMDVIVFLCRLGLPSLELRRLHLDLIFCYKLVFGLVLVSYKRPEVMRTNCINHGLTALLGVDILLREL